MISELDVAKGMKAKGYAYGFKPANDDRYFYVKSLVDIGALFATSFDKKENYPMQAGPIEIIIERLEKEEEENSIKKLREDSDKLKNRFKDELDMCRQVWEAQDACNVVALFKFAYDVGHYLSRNPQINKGLGTDSYSYHPVIYALVDKLASLTHHDVFTSEAFNYVLDKYNEAVKKGKEVKE